MLLFVPVSLQKHVNRIDRRVTTVALGQIPAKVALFITLVLLLGFLRAGCSSCVQFFCCQAAKLSTDANAKRKVRIQM